MNDDQNWPEAGLGDHNYCRNPDGEPRMWCYTTDPSKRWELCNPLPNTAKTFTTTECNENFSGNGANYRGCQTRTRSGKMCQPWDSQFPQTHRFKNINLWAGFGLGKHNYCRNPDNDESR